MQYLQNRKVVIYSIIIAVLLLLLYVVYSTYPALQSMWETESLLQAKEKELESARLSVENSAIFGPQDEFALDSTRKRIPERPDTELILRELKSLEAVSGLSFSNYSLNAADNQTDAGKPLTNGAVVPLQVSFTLKGKKTQLLTLLKEINDTERMFHVQRMNITSESRVPVALTDNNEVISCALTLMTYYVPNLQNFYKDARPVDHF